MPPRSPLWILGPMLVVWAAVVGLWYFFEWLVWFMRGAI